MRWTFRTINPLLNLEPSWNVAPTQMVPVVRRHPETGKRHLDLLQWGLLPYFTKDRCARRPINARAETVATSRMFRRAFELRRAIVPADAFYEWRIVEGGKHVFERLRFTISEQWPGWRARRFPRAFAAAIPERMTPESARVQILQGGHHAPVSDR